VRPSDSSLVFRLAIVLLALCAAACNMRLPNAKTPPPPQPTAAKAEPPPSAASNEPLSIPQTQVRLPRPQPIDPEALATPPITLPEPPTQRPVRRASKQPGTLPVPVNPVKPELPEPTETQSASSEAPTRPRVEPVLPADERRQLIEDIASRLKQVDRMLAGIDPHRLSGAEKTSVAKIHSFSALSRQAMERGETQQASALADRAFLLAQELVRDR
jgi:hypothetical protein